MNVLEITYKGNGSEKQVAWATDIFNKKMATLCGEYEYAMQRVESNSMPQSYKDAWEKVLNDDRAIKFVESVASAHARDIIDTKANIGNKCFATIIKKLADGEYLKMVNA